MVKLHLACNGKGKPYQRLRHASGKFFIFLLTLLLTLSGVFQASSAQTAGGVEIQPPEIDDFPNISVDFKVFSGNNRPVTGITLDQLTLYEDQQAVEIQSLDEVNQGTYFTLVINAGANLDVRDIDGVSPYQKITAKLTDWASTRRFVGSDGFSFVTKEGIGIHNSNSSETWITALNAYQPNFRTSTPSLDGLETAIQMAKDRVVPFGVDKTILYITPVISPEEINPIKTLTETARSAGISINIWMVDDAYFLTNDQGGALINMASATGGQFFQYTGSEILPEPADLLATLGKIFSITYQSKVRSTGTYPLTLAVNLPEGEIRGETNPFFIEVSAPKPIFISPAIAITRTAPLNTVNPQEALDPDQVIYSIIIEYPDGKPREIIQSRLIVDGQVVDERTQEPFDKFIWDISAIETTGEYKIKAEITDTLGLTSETIETSVMVTVDLPDPESSSLQSRQKIGLWISGGILLVALIILMIWGTWNFIQSVTFSNLTNTLFSLFKRSNQPQMQVAVEEPTISASLIPINTILDENEDEQLTLASQRITVGSSPEKASLVLSCSEIASAHAQLRLKDNSFWLRDLDSPEGTWLNYIRVSGKPVELHQGDIIHFGNKGFRYTILEGQERPHPHVQKYDPL
jgi:hypothetical protein